VKVRFASARKEVRASEVRKAVERDPAWSWLSVGNSSYLNGDIGIMCGDSKLRQTNHRVHPLVCLLLFLPFDLLELLAAYLDALGCMSRLLYLYSIPYNGPFMQCYVALS
jgi:hypothetical protein